jgi:hypothetical protein
LHWFDQFNDLAGLQHFSNLALVELHVFYSAIGQLLPGALLFEQHSVLPLAELQSALPLVELYSALPLVDELLYSLGIEAVCSLEGACTDKLSQAMTKAGSDTVHKLLHLP